MLIKQYLWQYKTNILSSLCLTLTLMWPLPSRSNYWSATDQLILVSGTLCLYLVTTHAALITYQNTYILTRKTVVLWQPVHAVDWSYHLPVTPEVLADLYYCPFSLALVALSVTKHVKLKDIYLCSCAFHTNMFK